MDSEALIFKNLHTDMDRLDDVDALLDSALRTLGGFGRIAPGSKICISPVGRAPSRPNVWIVPVDFHAQGKMITRYAGFDLKELRRLQNVKELLALVEERVDEAIEDVVFAARKELL